MFYSYIKVAIRNLSRNKVYSIVNISGLVLGLTCSILVIIYILQEMSYDQFHINADNIYRLGREVVTSDNVIREPLSSGPTAMALADEFPEIANVVRFGCMGRMVIQYEDNQFYEGQIRYVDPSVFELFIFLMIFIACLGIFALATYTAESRTKEIGIRKVMGATTFSIILGLNRDIIKLVGLSIIFACLFLQIPILDPHKFLAYFVDIHFPVYLKTALIIIFIALGAISYQAFRATTANPVKTLRYE